MKVRVLSQRGGDWLRGKLVSVHPHASKTATCRLRGSNESQPGLTRSAVGLGLGFAGIRSEAPRAACENRKPGLTPRAFHSRAQDDVPDSLSVRPGEYPPGSAMGIRSRSDSRGRIDHIRLVLSRTSRAAIIPVTWLERLPMRICSLSGRIQFTLMHARHD